MRDDRRVSRREALKRIGAAAVRRREDAAGSMPARAARLGANERIRLGVIGCGGMGTRHLEALAVNPQLRGRRRLRLLQAAVRERGSRW